MVLPTMEGLSVAGLKQTLAVFVYLFALLVVGPASLGLLVYSLFWTDHYWVSLLYGLWWLLDVQTCNRGGRQSAWVPWVRSWSIWRHLRDYFPIRLIKTSELNPRHNYILCCHPHGIICFGSVTCFASEAENFSAKFPGIFPHVNTIEGNLWMPGFREFFLMFGAVSSSKESLTHLLSTRGGGKAAVLMVGGVPEMENFQENSVRVVLNRRKGFIKLALRHGSHLVPTFVFGETHLYKQSGLFSSCQDWIRSVIGISPVLFYGRGFFQNSFGFLPYRRRMYVVVGSPIRVDRIAEPSQEDIDSLHSLYVRNVRKLFNKYNPIYGNKKSNLIIE